MNYIPIYEASDNLTFPIHFYIICVFAVVLSLYVVLTWKNNSTISKIFLCIFTLGLTVVILYMIIGSISSNMIYNKYINNEYYVVEGIIEDYVTETDIQPNYPDRFSVEGVDFTISNPSYTGYGYQLRNADGGILRNGLKCIIYYIPHLKENVIMKLLICKSD